MTSRNIHFSLALCVASLLVTPQGVQLSPLSASVMPDELNRELDRREYGLQRCIAPKPLASNLGGLFGPSAFSHSSNSDGGKRVSPSSKLHTGVDPDRVGNGGTACFDVTTNGENIGQIFIDDICDQTAPEDFVITVDGAPITKLHTDDSPCPDIPSDVFFSLPGHQSTAHVCVSVSDASGDCITVGAKAGNECFIAAVPLSDCTCSGSSARARNPDRHAPPQFVAAPQ
jgi:hypothetical protein